MDIGKGKGGRGRISKDFERNRDRLVEGPWREVHRDVVATNLRQMRLDAPTQRRLKNAEAEAQNFRRGIWGASPQIPAPRYTSKSSGSRPKRLRAPRANASATPKPKTPRKKKIKT